MSKALGYRSSFNLSSFLCCKLAKVGQEFRMAIYYPCSYTGSCAGPGKWHRKHHSSRIRFFQNPKKRDFLARSCRRMLSVCLSVMLCTVALRVGVQG